MRKMKSIKIVETKEDKENNKSPSDIKIIDNNSLNDNNQNDIMQPNTAQNFLNDKKSQLDSKNFPDFFSKNLI